jgi:hypothetical protein
MTQSSDMVPLSPKLMQEFAQMVTTVPVYEGGSAEGLLQRILSATSVNQLDSAWSEERAIPIGRPVFITGIQAAPSDYPGGLGFYLIASTVQPSTGEVGEYTIGAQMVVAQLVKAHVLGEFPLAGQIIETALKKDPSMKAQHFEVDHENTKYVREALAPKKAK